MSNKHAIERTDLEHVVDTAAEVFAEHGFTGVGVRELSEKCGVNPATLYYYFGSKEKLFEEVCRVKYRKAFDQTRHALVSGASPEQQLEQLCGRLFDLLLQDRTLFLLLRRDLIHGSVSGARFSSRQQYEGLIELFGHLFVTRHSATEARRLAFTAAALIFGYCEFVHVGQPDEPGECETFNAGHRKDLISALGALFRN